MDIFWAVSSFGQETIFGGKLFWHEIILA